MSKAQNCIEYDEIDGSPCFGIPTSNCTPSGWTGFGGTTPDIIDDSPIHPNGICDIVNLSGLSPGGGNMSLFLSLPTGYAEGMETTVTGLDTNIEYSFGLYWEMLSVLNCNSGDFEDGDLLITIDGVEYSFSGADSWELIEICIMPSSSSIDIILQIDNAAMGAIVVDSPVCSELVPCCTLILEVDEDEYTICPGDSFFFETDYVGGVGSVDIEWTCDPPEGLDYLSATDEIAPEFSFPPSTDFDSEEFKFTLRIEDDDCVKIEECIEVEVLTSQLPEFDVDLCDFDITADLPLESENEYFGTWTGDFDIEFYGNTTVTFAFTLDAGQNNCVQSYDYDFFVTQGVATTFDIDVEYCDSDDTNYELPAISEENIFGEWFPQDEINPYDLGFGAHVFQFFPNDDECTNVFELNIIVDSGMPVSFDLPTEFCADPNPFILPFISDDGVVGSWSMDEIDLNNPVLNNVITFTPDDLNSCSTAFDYQYSVIQNTIPTFDLPNSICRINQQISLNPISIENINGSWSPNEFNPISESTSIALIWTPDNPELCISTVEVVIPIIEKNDLNIAIPDTLCASNMNYNLPIIDTVLGDWNMSIIDLMDNINSQVTVLFDVDSTECFNDFIGSFFVVPPEIPAFNIADSYCSNDTSFVLPTMSDNLIAGSWNVTNINPNQQDSLEIIFTPNSTACIEVFYQTLYFAEIIDPTFDLPIAICHDADILTFSSTSVNGVTGTWTEAVLDPSSFNGNLFSNTFIVNDPACYSSISIDIEILSLESLLIESTDPAGCTTSDGSISFSGQTTDMQLSIDNGTSWSPITDLENLQSGLYEIQISFAALSECIETYSIQLNNSELPVIQDLIETDVSSCVDDNGAIVCIADGSDLEFSIDGINWQESNVFENLMAGNYILYVRIASSIDCQMLASTQILGPQMVEIISGDINDVTDCFLEDGMVQINATGDNLEFSIDNGIEWISANIFEELSAGQYTILVRDRLNPDCNDSISFEILIPQVPIIIDILETDATDCGVLNGMIEITTEETNPEFSIDNGNTWQTNSSFENLSPGSYTVHVRSADYINCIAESEAIINSPNSPQILSVIVTDPSDCLANDAIVEITTDIANPEFSLDGVNWQSDNVFPNLEFGDFTIYVRDALNQACQNSSTTTINGADCPCNDLDIMAVVEHIQCDDNDMGSIIIQNIDGFYTSEPYLLEWSNGDTYMELMDLNSGTYTLTVYYDLNCSYSQDFVVDQSDTLSFQLQIEDETCNDLGSIEVISLDGGFGNYQFSIDGNEYQNENEFDDLPAGDYSIEVNDFSDCSTEQEVSIEFIDNLEFEILEVSPIIEGATSTLVPTIDQASIDDFEWSPSEFVLDPNSFVAEVAPIETTEFTLTIYNGDCIESYSILVEVIPSVDLETYDVYLPNIIDFSQGEQSFYPMSNPSSDIPIETFIIYDRWGNLVFNAIDPEINDSTKGWDGYFNGQAVAVGVYTYMLVIERESGNAKYIYGAISVLF